MTLRAADLLVPDALAGRIALVTGGGTGIGRATAIDLAARGAAVENLAAGLALEWSRYGIRSICLAPGTIATDAVLEGYPAGDVERWARGVPLGRLGRPDEVSGLVCAPASPLGSYVTGTTITVDGGVDAWGSGEPAPLTDTAREES